MTPNAQRAAIATACGWLYIQSEPFLHGQPPWDTSSYGQPESIPLYLSDLDAMHDAESIHETKGRFGYDYCYTLGWVILKRAGLNPEGFCGEYRKINATADQRAEAFLRTLGLWDDAL